MASRDLAYSIFRGENSRPGLHVESDDKDVEYKMSDFVSSRARIATWDRYFISGGPFHRNIHERLTAWIERVDPQSYDWESIHDDLIDGVNNFKRKMSKYKERFIIFKVLGPTETAEGFFAKPLTSAHLKRKQLAHSFHFGVLLSLSFKRAIEVYERIAKTIMMLIELGCEVEFVDGIRIADDVAIYTGPIYPKEFIKEYLKWHRKFAETIHRASKLAILHTDGDITKLGLFNSLSEIYDGIHPLDVMPKSTLKDALTWVETICSIRSKLKDKLTFFTGIPIDLVFNDKVSVNELLQVVKELIRCHGVEQLVVATTHSPYPGRSYGEPGPLSKVMAIREFVLAYHRRNREPML